MVHVNILNTVKIIELAMAGGAKRVFCVSSDKAANPGNMMGASKRIMELFLFRYAEEIAVSTARFANVAFSDGSLLYGFQRRMEKKQPLAAPRDVRRYFIDLKESGELCLVACLLTNTREICFPKLAEDLELIAFSSVAERFLRRSGFEPMPCGSEEEARSMVECCRKKGQWPCYFFNTDTTGEKPFEEFYTCDEQVDLERFVDIGVVKHTQTIEERVLEDFLTDVEAMRSRGKWSKEALVACFKRVVPGFQHIEKNKYLDDRM
jgi:FlaA1/EpsC-like NDP-sugar epimerase